MLKFIRNLFRDSPPRQRTRLSLDAMEARYAPAALPDVFHCEMYPWSQAVPGEAREVNPQPQGIGTSPSGPRGFVTLGGGFG